MASYMVCSMVIGWLSSGKVTSNWGNSTVMAQLTVMAMDLQLL